jgi:hypothetical protein
MNHRSITLTILCAAIASGLFFTSGLTGGQSLQRTAAAGPSEKPIAANGGEVGRALRKWYAEGTAAGNIGDYYDNRDGGHSDLNIAPYPQLLRVVYTEEEIKNLQHWSLQKKILPFVTFGNSSTSASPEKGGSNVRQYYASPGGLGFLFTQYVRNNLYIYPEHRDHDPGNYGIGGYGDLLPTNTPYLIASQGSSGSDQSFMKAIPYVLAAFRPEVKKKLIQAGMLMPAIQMILRITGKQLSGPEEYLTGKAHPSVFRGSDVDVKRMVEMAHEITLSTIPPMVALKIMKEDTPIKSVDYFDPEQTEILADTPAVIARIFRSSKHVRKITVSAQESGDLNNRPLKFHWAVLRGDPDRIQIEYLNDARTVAEITVRYFRRAPIAEGSALESNRIDIGVFAHNGAYYSPPAFITFYTLDSEARTYGSDGRPLEIAYDVKASNVSITDWTALFGVLDSQNGSWRARFLRRHFKSREISGLNGISDDYKKAHAALLDARKRQEQADKAARAVNDAVKTVEARHAILETLHKTEQSEESRDSFNKATLKLEGLREDHKEAAAAARKARGAVNSAEKSEKDILEKEMPHLNRGASALVHEVLNSILKDPDLWSTDRTELEALYKSAGKEDRDAYEKYKQTLILFRLAEHSEDMLVRLNPVREPNAPSADNLTHYEQEMAAGLNATIMSRIVFPGIIRSERRKRFVDFRIASVKEWRDVYLYAPDKTPMGWRRYRSDGIDEFNADGFLVLEKDSQGRCIRARLVRYELESQNKDSQGRIIPPFRRKVRMIQTDMIREYGYEGADDWRGHITSRYLSQ